MFFTLRAAFVVFKAVKISSLTSNGNFNDDFMFEFFMAIDINSIDHSI